MGTPIQPLARGYTMTDGTGTPQVSPITSAASEAAIICPGTAQTSTKFRLNVYLPSAAGELRLVAGGATGGKATIPAGTWFSIPITPGDTVYINRAIATTIDFIFEDMA